MQDDILHPLASLECSEFRILPVELQPSLVADQIEPCISRTSVEQTSPSSNLGTIQESGEPDGREEDDKRKG